MTISSALRSRSAVLAGLGALALFAAGCGSPLSAGPSHAVKHHHVRLLALAHGKAHGVKPAHGHAVQRVVRAAPPPPFPQRRLFARRVLPILDQSVPLFDHTVAAVSSAGGLDNLDGVCGQYLSQVQIEESYLDGVPHPFPWFSAAGALHHQILGVLHDMDGALVACQTAVQAQDSGTAATATSDMGQAASQMRALDNYTRWLAQH